MVIVRGFLLMGLAGCARDPVEECRELVEAKDYPLAAERCAAAYEIGADPAAGVLAARALRQLDEDAAVLAWSERLRGSRGEPEALAVLAGLYRRRGEIDLAIETYRRQVEVAKRLGDAGQEGRGSYGLFYLAWEVSDFHAALEQAALALDAALRADDRGLAGLAVQAIFNLRYDLGDLEGAEQALDRAEELLPVDDAEASARQLAYRCVLQLDRGRYRLAADLCRRALTGPAGEMPHSFQRSTHLNLVKIYLELGELEQADAHLQAALAEREPDGSRTTALAYYRARLLLAQGRPAEAVPILEQALAEAPVADWAWDLEYRLGQALVGTAPDRAEEAYRRSVESLDSLRRDLGFDELKPWLLEKRRRPFEALFELRAEASRGVEALEVAEQAQARDFLDAFIAATVSEEALEPTAEGAAEGRSVLAIEPGATRRSALDRLLPSLQASPIVAPRPGAEIVERLSGRQVVMLFRTAERLWTLELADGPKLRSLPTPPAELRRLVSRWLANLDDLSLAEELGHRLLPADRLPASGHLVLVTDGELGTIPFAALRHGGRALVERFSLSQVPSLEALLALEESASPAITAPQGIEAGPLVLGDPLTDLPAAAEEARRVSELLGVVPRLGEGADRGALFDQPRASVLHVASHSGVAASGPWLALADGRLEAADVLASGLSPRLVVLASCASGARSVRGLWGSMGGAFLAAGSRAVLVSHWSIDDHATRGLIERFYREGGAAGDPAGALARAQRAAIAAGEPTEAWAAFVLIGLHRLP